MTIYCFYEGPSWTSELMLKQFTITLTAHSSKNKCFLNCFMKIIEIHSYHIPALQTSLRHFVCSEKKTRYFEQLAVTEKKISRIHGMASSLTLTLCP